MTKVLITASLILLTFTSTFSQDTSKADASLTAATVYFGYGAELTHNANINISTGTKQIVINQLSTAIDINSLQINVPENVALLSQRYQFFTPVVSAVINPQIKKWQDSIALFQKEINRNNNLSDIEEQTLEKTGKLIEITITNSGNKTITSEETLKLINAYNTKIEKSKLAIFKLSEEKDLLSEKIALLNKQSSESANGPVKKLKSYGQLILQVICGKNGEIPITLSYFTNNAGFTPLYDVRVNSKTNEMKLVYKAAVTQSTGIDWKQTKLTLSTSNPNWGGVAPIVNPWYLQEYVPQLYGKITNDLNRSMAVNSIQSMADDDKQLSEVIVVNGYGASKQKAVPATTYQSVDPSTVQKYTTLNESQLNTNYEIDLPYNIESDGQLHSVTIKEEKISANLKNYAVPKMDKDAYLLAEIADWQKLDLLPGSANIIMDNTYLGKSYIDPNSTADTLNLSLGKDKRVAIKRSVVKDYTSSKTSGNFTKQIFTYEITVKNNKTTQVDLLLKDQYPISTVKEIEVQLEKDNTAAVNEELGILTWKLALQPGESKKVRFSYTLKYPKEKRIYNL
jgi:uncharacterized protein (TIGR02231 family)